MSRILLHAVTIVTVAVVPSLSALRAQDPDEAGRRGGCSRTPVVCAGRARSRYRRPSASRDGELAVLTMGGNPINAAVAVGLTIRMMDPQMSGTGSNGFVGVFDEGDIVQEFDRVCRENHGALTAADATGA
jgi:Gamma-glutamyltranspeptidase